MVYLMGRQSGEMLVLNIISKAAEFCIGMIVWSLPKAINARWNYGY